jgi:hypothetical protein
VDVAADRDDLVDEGQEVFRRCHFSSSGGCVAKSGC